jgi:hypothetical protein
MNILILSLVVALLVCGLLLAVFGLFTTTPLGHRIERRENERTPRRLD